MFAAYFAPQHGAFIIALKPTDLLQSFLREHRLFVQLGWGFYLVSSAFLEVMVEHQELLSGACFLLGILESSSRQTAATL